MKTAAYSLNPSSPGSTPDRAAFGFALILLAIFALVCSSVPQAARAQAAKAPGQLVVYSIDVEGGQATLFVTPSGESLLVDTGWPGNNGRDAERIVAAMHDAGVKRIDHLLVTHYHIDHAGGVTELVKRVAVGEFLDHGPNRESTSDTTAEYDAYMKVVDGHPHRVLRPGDTINIPGLSIVVLAADGDHISSVPGITPTPNPYCTSEHSWPVDPSEDARSVGILITFGKLKILDLGDLTGQKEVALACPSNPIGTVDLYLVTHHGMDISNPRAIVDAVHPRVAIMNNGARKAGDPAAWQIVHDSPGLEDLWQIHTAERSDAVHNTSDALTANLRGSVGTPADGAYLKVFASANGSFSITNSRTGQTKEYLHK